MQTVTKEQIYGRWEQVPEILREAFFSLENGEIIWNACEEAGLPEEVIDNVVLVVGNILFGFTHVNDLAKELQSIPGMDPKAIDPIIFQIDRRIFAPIKGELLKLSADISGTGPRIVAESAERSEGDATAVGADRAPAMIPSADAQVEIRKVRIGEEARPGENTQPVTEGARSEATESAEGPTIIHTEAELRPVAQKRRPLSSFGGMFGFRKGAENKTESSAVTAQVSMIEGLGRKPEEVARTEQQPVKVVHYTSAKAPEDIFGQSSVAQNEATGFVPVTKQEHMIDFEPKVVDMNAHADMTTIPSGAASISTPVPAMPEDGKPLAPMPKMPEITVMKTPQRVETIAEQAPPVKEPQLAEIPVNDDVVDLRMLERVDQQPRKQ